MRFPVCKYNVAGVIIIVIRGVARGNKEGRPPPMIKMWCSRNAQICNKIDTLEGSIEIASATAIYNLEKDTPLCPKGRLPNI